MPLVPSLGSSIPGSSFHSPSAGSEEQIDPSLYPNVYTSTGPLPARNGLAFTVDAMVFDPNAVTEGTLDCGVFGSLA